MRLGVQKLFGRHFVVGDSPFGGVASVSAASVLGLQSATNGPGTVVSLKHSLVHFADPSDQVLKALQEASASDERDRQESRERREASADE